MTDLTRYSELVIRQQIEQMEIFTPFETANRYGVYTAGGTQLMHAYEESGGISRQFAGSRRALSIHVVEGDGAPVLHASRDFFWFRSHLRVDAGGRRIGALNRVFGFGRKLALVDSEGHEITRIASGFTHPNTFIAEDEDGHEIARVTKEWSGFGREMFTDADTFVVQFTNGSADNDFRLLMLASAFAIDLDFFENQS
ncbi:MAG: phospholipid scramblase-related protein [Chloroflexi bacterium]|nr:phospholipid scramblase-related protein [Chloroflexota bacterium]MCY3638282.1 phospholipid scramblase-related protein [Chloroflexota bacterium]